MHPSAPADGSTPAPTDSMQSLVAHLDDVMAQAEIAANAERDLDAETPTATPARQEAQPDDDAEDDEADESVPDDESQEDEDEGESEDAEAETERPKPTAKPAADAPRYSRRDAARFAGELETTKKDLETIQSQLRSHQGELAHVRSSDQQVRQLLQEQSGYVAEQNGRFRYENLRDKVLKGTATEEEANDVARMTQWHEFAGPIFRAAEDIALRNFSVNWESLKELDGVGQDGLSKLNSAPNSIEATKQLHSMAYAAGESKAKSDAEQEIARLRAQVKSLRTRQVASAPQPATANGAGVPSNGGFLSRAVLPDGTSNPEFDREVASGKWIGADLTQR